MEPGTVRMLDTPAQRSATARPLPVRPTVAEPVPDEPTAVIFAGAAGSGHHAVAGALLGEDEPLLDVPDDSYLVVTHLRPAEPLAYVPGARHAQPLSAAGSAGRPPRRVEVGRADPLLRHFTVLAAPDTRRLGLGGARVLVQAATRGGAVAYALRADTDLEGAELDVLTRLARAGVRVFFVLTPGADGTWGPPTGALSDALAHRRAAIATTVPSLADAPWFAVDASFGDVAYLRRALVEWADTEGLRRASGNPPVLPGAGRAVRVAPSAHECGWEERLDEAAGSAAQAVRQRLSLELANIHLRSAHEISVAGSAVLPQVLDRELHALSLQVLADCQRRATAVIDELLVLVLAEAPQDDVRRRLGDAVRRGFDEQAPPCVLLVTNTGGVASLAGAGAVDALAAYRGDGAPPLLPEVGVGLSAGCYRHWRGAGNGASDEARAWLQRAVRAVEIELTRTVAQRFEVLARRVGVLLAEAVDHEILLR